MTDEQIVGLFWGRSEDAIAAADQQYGAMCRSIANNLLGSQEDAEECVNDTWHTLWCAIPPEKPEKLGPYIAKIVRNLAMKQLTRKNAKKRTAAVVSYEELSTCIPGGTSAEEMLEAQVLSEALKRFRDTLDRDSRDLFLRRYWFCDSIEEIAKNAGMSQRSVTKKLYRIRNKLKDFLKKEEQIDV